MARTLFYLDAHGGDSLPLRDELEVIFAAFPVAVVLIDDFAVPGDSGYGFDDYGPGRVINLDYVERSRLPPLHIFFPATPSRFETGRRRGWAVATADEDLASRLGQMTSLVPWQAKPPSSAPCPMSVEGTPPGPARSARRRGSMSVEAEGLT